LTKVFISYRRDDSAYIAANIYEKLQNHFGGDSVFFDIDTIPLGTDFRKHISNSVQQCDVLLAVIGDSWVNSADEHGKKRLDDPADFVRLEIESALTREIPVIPVLELSFRNATEVRAGLDLQQHLSRLITGIESLTPSTTPDTNKKVNALTDKSKQPNPGWKRWVYSILSIGLMLFLVPLLGTFGPYYCYSIYTDNSSMKNCMDIWERNVYIPMYLSFVPAIFIWRRYSRK